MKKWVRWIAAVLLLAVLAAGGIAKRSGHLWKLYADAVPYQDLLRLERLHGDFVGWEIGDVLALVTRDARCIVIDRDDPEYAGLMDILPQSVGLHPWEKLYCVACQNSRLDRETRQIGYFVDESGHVLSGGVLIPSIF